MNSNTSSNINQGVDSEDEESKEQAVASAPRRHSASSSSESERLADEEASRNLARTLQSLIKKNKELRRENDQLRHDIGLFTGQSLIEADGRLHDPDFMGVQEGKEEAASVAAASDFTRQQHGPLSNIVGAGHGGRESLLPNNGQGGTQQPISMQSLAPNPEGETGILNSSSNDESGNSPSESV